MLPEQVATEDDPDSDAYWRDVSSVIDSIPPRLSVKSESMEQLQQRLIPQLSSESARDYALSIALRLFIMSLLDAPCERLGVPDHLNEALDDIVGELGGYFQNKWVVAQRALDALVAALSSWELEDRVNLSILNLRLPFVPYFYGIGEGLLIVGAFACREFRLNYFQDRLPADFKNLSPIDFSNRCRRLRNNPHLVTSLLKRLPPKLVLGSAFEKVIFGDRGHPESGRMALAYCCKNFTKLWMLMGWPCDWTTQNRLINFAPWHIKPEDMDDVLARKRVV
jgi:hypothetical protein